MAVPHDRQPVIVATGQVAEREALTSPVELMVRAAEEAFGSAPGMRDRIEQVSVVNVVTGSDPAPASSLARLVGLRPRRCETTTVGGNSAQWLVNRAAEAIWSGDLDAALIAGGEAQRSAHISKSSRPGGGRPEPHAAEPEAVVGDERPGFGEAEMNAGLLAPVHVYPLFESAIAHTAGRTHAEQRRFLGEFLSRMTKAAASHRCAWFPVERSAEEIAEPSEDNRVVSEPYTKMMCAFPGVDQAAAVIVCSYATARSAGVADDAVFCVSGADSSEVWFPTARPSLGSLPGLRAAGSSALDAAGLGIEEVDRFDLYSCFPCAVEMGAEALGIAIDDARGLTVTGGLPYFGGAWNCYTLFAIATMAEKVRGAATVGRADRGLVNGIGWYATKHSVGVYASEPSSHGWRRGETLNAQEQIDASAIPVVVAAPVDRSIATVAASTVSYGPTGQVTGAPVIATLEDGRRVAAAADPSVDPESVRGVNLVGERVLVSGLPPRYVRP
jgi:acetyl-CoA C-acetyltransferase